MITINPTIPFALYLLQSASTLQEFGPSLPTPFVQPLYKTLLTRVLSLSPPSFVSLPVKRS